MKKAFYVLLLLCSYTLSAQTPQFIHYQAVMRDGNGAVLSNQTIGLKLEITQGQYTYTEVRTVTTNNLGLVNLNVGSLPAPNSIPFSSINWADGNASLLTWYDPTNTNTNWQYIGSSSIASVPYALHAANVFSGDFNDLTNVPNIDTSATNELQTISSQGDTIHLSGGGFIYFERFSGDFADLNGVPNLDTSSTNELQSIAQNGDTISISKGGGSVVISTFSGDFGDLTNVPPIDTSNVNELQVLSMSGDTLYLSNGGFVVLPLSSKAEKLDDLSDAKTLNNSLGLGVHALHSMDSNAYNNVAVGEFSLENLQGAGDNTAVGTRSMRLNTIGGYNTAVGFEALYSNTVGQQNTAIGNNAMWENLSGFQNTALGSHALMNSRVGQGITAVGFGALRNANSSGPNDALGKNTLKNLTVGTSNVAIGVNSLLTLGADSTVEQYRNTVIGSSALMRLEHGTNNIGIGNEVGAWLTGGSYNVIIGGVDGPTSQTQRSISGNVIIGRAAAALISDNSSNNTILGTEAGTLVHNNLNTLIGYKSNVGDSLISNSVAIGSNSTVSESNMVVLGGVGTNKVSTDGAFIAGNMSNSSQLAGITIHGSSNGPSSPTGKFIRSSNRNNVLTFENESNSVGGSIGLLGKGFKGENFMAISTFDTLNGWSRPLSIELGSSTDLLELKKNSSIEMADAVLVKEIQDTSALSESAALEIKSTSKGFLPPRMNSMQRDAIINPETGLVLYCTNCGSYGELQVFNGVYWANLLGDSAQASITPIPSIGLVGYWPFNGNANDVSGNAKHGVTYNSPSLTTNRFGQPNSAYAFDWTNVTGYGSSWQKIELPDINVTGEFTINAWINPSDYCWPNNSIKSAMILAGSASCQNIAGDLRFGLSNNFGAFSASHNGTSIISDTGLVTLNQWHMLTMKVTQDSIFLYLNGQLSSVQGHTVQPNISSCLSIGLHHQGNGHWYYFNGKIDDLSIWSRLLSDSEIQSLYNSDK